MFRFLTVILLCVVAHNVLAQLGRIVGSVAVGDHESVIGLTVFLEGTDKGDITDVSGSFKIDGVVPGTYKLVVSGLGYKRDITEVSIGPGETLRKKITLEVNAEELHEVTIHGKSESRQLQEQGYSVKVIEAKAHKNLSSDLNGIIRLTPGINIRESGGMGSNFNLSLNGLSGNQIRYFIDGVPMENFGSSLTLNNYPVNLIEKIEIYKGVVPIQFGADALGGAINIVTGYRRRSYLDAAYSIGSFNTHRTSFTGQFANPNGFFVKSASFFNHSDNNYWMDEVPLTDSNGNIIDNSYRTRRFHDHYTSGMTSLEFGVFDKSFADEWSINLTGAANRKNYQHPDFNIKRIFGKFHTKSQTFLGSTTYSKKFSKLDTRVYFLIGETKDVIVDTTVYKYDWSGEAVNRLEIDPNDTKGELGERRSLFELTDKIMRSQAYLNYEMAARHYMDINFSQNYLQRSGIDKVDELNRSFESPNFINKNIAGGAYRFNTPDKEIEASLFVKGYWYTGKIITQDFDDNDRETNVSVQNLGYGTAMAFQTSKLVRLKTSFERAIRLPEPTEVLGSGLYVLPNPNLEPEQSYNVNLGARYDQELTDLKLHSELNLFFRHSRDFIAPPRSEGPFGVYENLNNVRTEGIEGSARAEYKDLVAFNANVTYQNITDRTAFDEGLPNVNYKSKIPNTPYFFMNGQLTLKPFRELVNKTVTFHVNSRYVHEFFLKWENLGNPSEKNTIPSQLTFDLIGEYSFDDGRYNVSATLSNLTNTQVYDNFLIQKPGRAFYIKLRYFLNK